MSQIGITRLAPSPTGALHLGNARTFLINYLLARSRGWQVLMRVEDLDGPRIKAAASEQMLDELSWLGLRWEEPIVFQSHRTDVYRSALERLIDAGEAYPCTCSRKDVERAASAPHRDDGQTPYPGACRGRFTDEEDALEATGRAAAWRVRVDREEIVVDDRFAGKRTFRLREICGDFVVFRNDGLASYQLAVVLDDASVGVNRIVRGDDLLDSAARQIYLRRLLGISDDPQYWHLPLVVGPDGKRLAKRHGDTRLGFHRRRGASPQRVLGLLGHLSGLLPERRETDMGELLERFDMNRLSHQPTVFAPEDDEFLRTRG